MKDKLGYIPDPTYEDGFEGMFLGSPDDSPESYQSEPLGFDLRAAAKYVRDHNLQSVTDEIKEMFKK